jgi:hypothetical protein
MYPRTVLTGQSIIITVKNPQEKAPKGIEKKTNTDR